MIKGRRHAAGIALAMAVILPASAAAAGYGGWQTTSASGVNGYIQQAVTASTSNLHAAWVNLCWANCAQWVQIGTFQGTFRGGTSLTAVHMYYENQDVCGSYFALDKGAPPSSDYPYAVFWDGKPSWSVTCPNGSHRTGFTYKYTKGGVTTTPIYFGTGQADAGLPIAVTEIQGTALENTDYFGCDAAHACSSSSYGLHLFNGTTWRSWTDPSQPQHANPPFVRTFHNFWAFKTCPAAC